MKTESAEARDNRSVDEFCEAMKAKLKQKRAEGRHGWHDHTVCDQIDLARALVEHVEKGDPVDIANFAMMLFHREPRGMITRAIMEEPTK